MSVDIHASCIRLGRAGKPFGAPPGTGILLTGKSGAGKSDLALRLIFAGAELVADDRTLLFVRGGALWAKAPPRGAGLIEVRGAGILKLPHSPAAKIVLVAELGRAGARLPAPCFYPLPAALCLPKSAAPPAISLNPFEASAPAKLAAAAAGFAKGLYREDINPI